MRLLSLSCLGLMFVSVAAASPIQLSHSGRIMDVTGGPVTGMVNLDVDVFVAGASVATHTNTYPNVSIVEGYYSVFLDVDTDTFLSATEVEVRVDGVVVSARQPLVRVPNAAVADVAARVAVTVDTPAGDCGEEGGITWSRASAALFVCDDAGEWQSAGGGAGDSGGSVDPGNFNAASTGETLFTVPAGVTSLTVHAWGGGGAGGNQGGATGGGGAYVEASIAVTPGEELQIQVAEGGDAPGSAGGASLVLRSGAPLVVAAGGGGGASDGASGSLYTGGAGGAGGGLTGESGTSVANPQFSCAQATAGSGGTQNAGGAGGTAVRVGGNQSNDCSGANGAFLEGGRCSSASASTFTNSGLATNGTAPGGGSGYYGGGSGGGVWTYCAAGGGGGSSYAESGATNILLQGGSGPTPGDAVAGAGGLRFLNSTGGFGTANEGQDGRIELSWGG